MRRAGSRSAHHSVKGLMMLIVALTVPATNPIRKPEKSAWLPECKISPVMVPARQHRLSRPES